jgi:hypothetical protein
MQNPIIPEYLEKKDSLLEIQYILILDCESADTQHKLRGRGTAKPGNSHIHTYSCISV